MILLTRPAALPLLDAIDARAGTAESTLDLGRTTIGLPIEEGRVVLPDDQRVDADGLRVVAANPESVYTVIDDAPEKVTWFSAETNKVYTLRATGGWPALEISGILMHRVKDTDPRADAASKLAAIGPVRGRVLETCCGLGYTAIHAAETADRVTVFEVDENVLDMARLNPYSAPLFEEPGPIDVRLADVADAITELPDEAFDFVIHDPPTLALAGELYGDAFYRQLLRVLRPRGRLFHYTGDPGSRTRGQDLPGRVAERLGSAGFAKTRRVPEALGVSAVKP